MRKKVEQWFTDHDVRMVSGWIEGEKGDTIIVDGGLMVWDVSDLGSIGLQRIEGCNDGLMLLFTTKSLAEWLAE